MRAKQLSWNETRGWNGGLATEDGANLVLYFGARQMLADTRRFDELRDAFPHARILGCSTGGQIRNDDVGDDSIAAVAVRFDATRLQLACEAIAGRHRVARLRRGDSAARSTADDLAGIFVLSDGLNVNGSELVAGITGVVGPTMPLTGGLAGDGADLRGDRWSAPTARRAPGRVARDRLLRLGDPHRPRQRRRLGRSSARAAASPARPATCCYELDGEPALDLYERYLGEEEAKGLPGTACCSRC